MSTLGEVEVRPDDVVGLTVSITKRICDLAGPADVFVSEAVKALLVGSGITTSEQGTYVLKGVPDEWRLYAIEADTPTANRNPPNANAPKKCAQSRARDPDDERRALAFREPAPIARSGAVMHTVVRRAVGVGRRGQGANRAARVAHCRVSPR